MSCTDCPIRTSAVCAKCEQAELAQLAATNYYRTFEAGQQVVWAGDRLDFVGSVVSGVAAISQALDDGRTQMVGLLHPSDFIGRPGRSEAHFDVRAVSDLTLCCFRRAQFEQLIADVPRIGQRLLEMTLCELDAARDWMLTLGRKSAKEKTASLLLVLAQRHNTQIQGTALDTRQIDLPLTREMMADYLGLSLETVCREIAALRREQIIQLKGKRTIIVPDIAALANETGDALEGGVLG